MHSAFKVTVVFITNWTEKSMLFNCIAAFQWNIYAPYTVNTPTSNHEQHWWQHVWRVYHICSTKLVFMSQLLLVAWCTYLCNTYFAINISTPLLVLSVDASTWTIPTVVSMILEQILKCWYLHVHVWTATNNKNGIIFVAVDDYI